MLCILVDTKVTTALISKGLKIVHRSRLKRNAKSSDPSLFWFWPPHHRQFLPFQNQSPALILTASCLEGRSNKNWLWLMGVTLRPTVNCHLQANHFCITSELGLGLRHFEICSLPNSLFGTPCASWAGFLGYSRQSNDLCRFNISLGLVCRKWNIGFDAFPRYLRIFSALFRYIPYRIHLLGLLLQILFFLPSRVSILAYCP